MTNDMPEFGLQKNRTPIDRYIGKYVFIDALSGSNVAGRLTGIDGDFLVLNPFQGGVIDKEKGMIRKLIEDDSIFNTRNIGNIEPTTKENIEAGINYINKKNSKD